MEREKTNCATIATDHPYNYYCYCCYDYYYYYYNCDYYSLSIA